MASGNQEYKDRLFSFVFGSEEHKEWTLSLYNAINGTHYDNPDDISIETIRQVLYMGACITMWPSSRRSVKLVRAAIHLQPQHASADVGIHGKPV